MSAFKKYLAEFIGERMAKKFQEKFPNYHGENLFIVSVPMLEKDVKTRGFDHAKLIAEVVSNRLEIPTLFGVLEKVKEDKEMFEYDPEEAEDYCHEETDTEWEIWRDGRYCEEHSHIWISQEKIN